MQTLLSKALVASVTVAGLGLLAAPQASAAVIAGSSLSFSGELSTTLPANTATTQSTAVDATSLSFDGATDYIFSPLTFNFTEVAAPTFSMNPFTVEIVGGGAAGTVISFGGGTYTKIAVGQTTIFSPAGGLVGVDGDGKGYTGAIFFSQSGVPASASYSGSFAAVPEPLTMMGASAAIAFGAAFKRRNANKG